MSRSVERSFLIFFKFFVSSQNSNIISINILIVLGTSVVYKLNNTGAVPLYTPLNFISFESFSALMNLQGVLPCFQSVYLFDAKLMIGSFCY